MTEDEVLQILDLVEKSNFDFLELQLGDLKLTVNKSGVPMPGMTAAASVTVAEATTPSPPPAQPAGAATQPASQASAPGTHETVPHNKPVTEKEGTLPIKAPMVGTFYATPEPGAAPFVKLGDPVDEETTVGLVEVMKVFNAVSSGVTGVIEEICVDSGQFVEHGQTLFLVRPQ